MGTLAKVAIGYAAARGVDKMAGGQGLSALLGGAQVKSGDAQAEQAPGMDQMQSVVAQMGGQMANVQDMMTKFAAQSGFDLSAIMGGAASAGDTDDKKPGLLSSVPTDGAGAGLAGLLSALGGAAATTGQNVGGLLDQFNTADAAPQADEIAALMLRAMIQAAKADGAIDTAEQAKIMESVGEDADPDDITFVQDQLVAKVDVDKLAKDTPEGLQMQVYSMSLMSIRVDSAAEAQYLDQLARALGLNQQTVNALHLQMGVQPLYS